MGSILLSAEYSSTPGHMALHFHDCHQILYISQGQIRITVSEKTYHAGPGSVVLISRFEEHSIQVESSIYCRYSLQIPPQALVSNPLFSLLVNRPEHFRHALLLDEPQEAQQLFGRILLEHRSAFSMGEKMLELLLQQLLILICRAYPENLMYGESELRLIRQIQHRFESDPAQKYTLSILSRQHHISPSHLSHLFKKVTGTSVMGYLTSCRFAAAKRFLAQTSLPVGRVAELCGFSDSSNFSRSFKALTCLSPSEFRQQFRSADPERV